MLYYIIDRDLYILQEIVCCEIQRSRIALTLKNGEQIVTKRQLEELKEKRYGQ